jgi:hypothetical protein
MYVSPCISGTLTDLQISRVISTSLYPQYHNESRLISSFYCQNIRNNTNRARTPKWALKAGLIDTTDRERRLRKNQWSKRFDERNAQSAHVGQALEEGEEGDNYVPVSEQEQERERRREHEGLWNDNDDTEYYNEGELSILVVPRLC